MPKKSNACEEVDFGKIHSESSDDHDPYSEYRIKGQLNRDLLITPIFDPNPDFIELYYKAWELAYSHVLYRQDAPQKWYIDEAMTPKRIWIWDTCFMALYCKYAPDQFPGVESLNNFYFIMHDRKKAPFRIHHPDNPPLFAWVEWEYFKITGDLKRLKWVLLEGKYLPKHFEFIENSKRKRFYSYAGVPLYAEKKEYGFRWSGISSGMDNTPRGRGKYSKILWLDLAAQQALSAYYIIKIARTLFKYDSELSEAEKGEISQIIGQYTRYYDEYRNLLNTFYWDSEDGFYFDIYRRRPSRKCKVITPASFWAVLAGVPDEQRVKLMMEKVRNPLILGGSNPLPSVSRNDTDFDPRGQYWRGGIWLPTSYMSIKAIEHSGDIDLASNLSMRTLVLMAETYKRYEPHTIWEAYSPSEFAPSTYKRNRRMVRRDFCGWSALGPISLLIENVIGIYKINSIEGKLHWHINLANYKPSPWPEQMEIIRVGVKNLRMGFIKNDKGRYAAAHSSLDLILKLPASLFAGKKQDAGDQNETISHEGETVELSVNNKGKRPINIILSGNISEKIVVRPGLFHYKLML